MNLSRLLQIVSAHRTIVWTAAVVLFVLALVIAIRGRYENGIDGIFAKGSISQKTMALLQESGLSDKLVVSFRSDSETLSAEQIAWIDGFADDLSEMPQVREALFRILPEDLGKSMDEIVPALPQLMPPPDFSNPQSVCNDVFRQLMIPAPGVVSFVRSDPYGLRTRIMERLQALRKASGVRLDSSKTYPASADQRHAAIKITLNVPHADNAATAVLLDEIVARTREAPFDLHAAVVGAAVHTLGNESVVKRDLRLLGWLSPLFLVALFMIVFRGDWHCVWIPVIPLGALLLSTAILSVVTGGMQFFVLGIGGSILGLAVDQGIHIYLACRTIGRRENLLALVRPLSLAAGTSIAVFALMLLLKSPALQQLGALSAMGLLFSLVAGFLLLPTLVPADKTDRPAVARASAVRRFMSRRNAIGILTALSIGSLVLCTTKLRFEFEISRLDGAPKQVWEDEASYAAAWVPHTPPILLVRQPDSPQAQSLMERIDACAPVRHSDSWPNAALRAENLAAWRAIDLDATEDSLRHAAEAAGLNRSDKPDFFAPFFDGIRDGLANPPAEAPSWLGTACRQLRNGDVSIVFLGDTDGLENALAASDADAVLLSPDAFRHALTTDFGRQLLMLFPLACAAVLLLAIVILRSWKGLLLAFSTVFLTLLFTCALLTEIGRPITLMGAVAAMLLVGLSVDYGVFAAQWMKEDFAADSTIPKAIALSAATTIFTSALLLFSKHPVLFDIGLMLSIGISIAFLLARFLLPPICGKKLIRTSAMPLLLFVCALALSSCATPYPKRARMYPSEAMREIAMQPAPPEKICAKVTLNFLWIDFPMVIASNVDYSERVIKIVGMTSVGTELFHFEASPEKVLSGEPLPIMPKMASKLSENIALDMARLLLDNRPATLAAKYSWTRGSLRFKRRGQNFLFAGNPLSLWRKSVWKNGLCIWSVERLDEEAKHWLFNDNGNFMKLDIEIL
ncbi:MAG: MMPL family transporter [Lentisphaeria bacterium]|nr:MMPL family transporter [Lentisphaeria bacterium]